MDMYTELNEIFKYLDKEKINKLPTKLLNFIKSKSNEESDFKIDPNKDLEKQNISEDALAFIAFLNLKYWCNDREKKKELKEIYIRNNKKERD